MVASRIIRRLDEIRDEGIFGLSGAPKNLLMQLGGTLRTKASSKKFALFSKHRFTFARHHERLQHSKG
jgi:hypothetical protein